MHLSLPVDKQRWIICLFVTNAEVQQMGMKEKEIWHQNDVEKSDNIWHQNEEEEEEKDLEDSLRVSILSLEVWHVSD